MGLQINLKECIQSYKWPDTWHHCRAQVNIYICYATPRASFICVTLLMVQNDDSSVDKRLKTIRDIRKSSEQREQEYTDEDSVLSDTGREENKATILS